LEDVLRTFYQAELQVAGLRWLSWLPRFTGGRRSATSARPPNVER
jgi:hypothetical protein